jgi:hypothetical protein
MTGALQVSAFRGKADMDFSDVRFCDRYWGLSGHALLRCLSLLLTQSGHWWPDVDQGPIAKVDAPPWSYLVMIKPWPVTPSVARVLFEKADNHG